MAINSTAANAQVAKRVNWGKGLQAVLAFPLRYPFIMMIAAFLGHVYFAVAEGRMVIENGTAWLVYAPMSIGGDMSYTAFRSEAYPELYAELVRLNVYDYYCAVAAYGFFMVWVWKIFFQIAIRNFAALSGWVILYLVSSFVVLGPIAGEPAAAALSRLKYTSAKADVFRDNFVINKTAWFFGSDVRFAGSRLKNHFFFPLEYFAYEGSRQRFINNYESERPHASGLYAYESHSFYFDHKHPEWTPVERFEQFMKEWDELYNHDQKPLTIFIFGKGAFKSHRYPYPEIVNNLREIKTPNFILIRALGDYGKFRGTFQL